MAVQHTPITQKPQLPRHRPDLDHPYRWEFLMSGKQISIDVELKDQQILIESVPQEQQQYLESIHKIKSDPMFIHVNSNPARVTSTPANLGGDRGTTPAHGVTAEGTTGGGLDRLEVFDNNNFDNPDWMDEGLGDKKLERNAHSPTPTEASLEEIKERTKITEESLRKNTEVKKLPVEDQNEEKIACRNRHHEFEQRTKTHLSAPARRFIKAYKALLTQLDRTRWSDEVEKPFGDDLLDDVQQYYLEVEQAREYCLEPLNEVERLEKLAYMEEKFLMKCKCERVHRKYFDQQEKNERLRLQYQQQQMQQEQMQPPTINEKEYQIPSGRQPPMDFTTPTPQGIHQEKPGFPASMDFLTPIHKESGRERPRFQVFQDQGPSIPINQRDASTYQLRNPVLVERQPQRRFKLEEELALVARWGADKPRAYLAFRAQWNNFVTKMETSGRSQIDLYYALLKKLDDKAKDLVETQYPDDNSYKRAISQLDKLFYEPTNLLRDLISKLLRTNKMVDTYESLLSGVSKLSEAWRDLEQANLDKEQLKGLLFIAATEKNLSEGAWREWLEIQNRPSENPMDCFQVESYMGAIHMAMTNAQKRQNAMGKPNYGSEQRPKPKPRSTLYGSYNTMTTSTENNPKPTQNQARTKDGQCVFCKNQPHKYQLYCPNLKKMTPDEIFNIMKEKRIFCRMCLCLGHNQNECQAVQDGILKKCTIKKENGELCNAWHCRYLHRSYKKEATPKSDKRSNQ